MSASAASQSAELDTEISTHQTLYAEPVLLVTAGLAFALLFMDIDFFKEINDAHGHAAGNRALKELSILFKKCVRESDILFRYGGDEFIALLDPCDLLTATAVAERIRQTVMQYDFLKKTKHPVRLTISIGIALWPQHARTKKDLIEAADQAMYQAKKLSRNLVYIAKESENQA